MDRLDVYEQIPRGMREYLSHYGWHFSQKLAEYATDPKRMKNADGSSHRWTHEEVKQALERNGLTIEKAKGYKHMTFREAATLARDAGVGEMWLTHYSPSLVRPDDYMDTVREIFPKAWPGKDGKSVELNFEED